MGLPVINATDAVMVVHQNHAYAHVVSSDVWEGPEAQYDRQLAEGGKCIFTLEDFPHKLTANGLKITLNWEHFHRRLRRLKIQLQQRILDLTRPVRYPLRLRTTQWERLKARFFSRRP